MDFFITECFDAGRIFVWKPHGATFTFYAGSNAGVLTAAAAPNVQ